MNNNKKKGLGIKILGSIGLIIIFLIITMVLSITRVISIRGQLTNLHDKTVTAMEASEQLRYDVLHTAEILTDVSATHDTEGYTEAEEIKSDFATQLETIKSLETDDVSKWDEINEKYGAFYDLCYKMSEAYIKSGLDAGNELMEQVDPVTEELSELVNTATKGMQDRLENEVDSISASAAVMAIITLITSVLNLLIAGIIAMIVLKQVINPIKKVSTYIRRLSERDLTVNELYIKQKDEIGELATAYNTLRSSLKEIMGNMDSSTSSLEDMSRTMAEQSGGILDTMSEITQAINSVSENATDQASDVAESIDEVHTLQGIAAQNNNASSNLSDASDQISEASQNGTRILDSLYEITKKSEIAFAEIFDSIDKIKNSTGKIGEASSMIESIASQTNLLSLNASIEAARAGEQGKGFAVVADEIRKLSDESTASVNEINTMLQELQINVDIATERSENVKEAVEKQVRGVEETRDSYAAIASTLDIINNNISSLGDVSNSLSQSCDNVSSVLERLAVTAEQNAASAEETNASIEEVLAMSEKIAEGSSGIKGKADEIGGIVNLYQM